MHSKKNTTKAIYGGIDGNVSPFIFGLLIELYFRFFQCGIPEDRLSGPKYKQKHQNHQS